MSESAKNLIDQALELSSSDRAIVAEQILLSLDRPNPVTDAVWATEAEDRIDAYAQGKIEGVSVREVLGKYSDE